MKCALSTFFKQRQTLASMSFQTSLFSNAAVLSLSQAFHLTLKSSPFYSHSLENKFQDFSLIFILATAASDSIKQLYSLEKCL